MMQFLMRSEQPVKCSIFCSPVDLQTVQIWWHAAQLPCFIIILAVRIWLLHALLLRYVCYLTLSFGIINVPGPVCFARVLIRPVDTTLRVKRTFFSYEISIIGTFEPLCVAGARFCACRTYDTSRFDAWFHLSASKVELHAHVCNRLKVNEDSTRRKLFHKLTFPSFLSLFLFFFFFPSATSVMKMKSPCLSSHFNFIPSDWNHVTIHYRFVWKLKIFALVFSSFSISVTCVIYYIMQQVRKTRLWERLKIITKLKYHSTNFFRNNICHRVKD